MLLRLYEMYLYTVLGYVDGVSPESLDYLGIANLFAVITMIVLILLGIKFIVWMTLIPFRVLR